MLTAKVIQVNFSLVAIFALAFVLSGCATPASLAEEINEENHQLLTYQRNCDLPKANGSGSCNWFPHLPPKCEPPGTYQLPACKRWIEDARTVMSSDTDQDPLHLSGDTDINFPSD